MPLCFLVFIELTDLLRCPVDHPEAHLVVATGEMKDRAILRGIIGCPVCQAEFHVDKRIAHFGSDDAVEPSELPADAAALHSFLGLSNPGGYVVLVGSAVRAAAALGELLGAVHLVGINAPNDVAPAPMLSLLESPGFIPLRTASVRGVVIGRERVSQKWLAEAARVLLPGLRMVVLSEQGEAVGVDRMATGPGVWVGKKRGTSDG